jgi:hypothetical protein
MIVLEVTAKDRPPAILEGNMDAKEAREIIETQEKQLSNRQRMNTQTVSQEYTYMFAKGYLEALKGPEVKMLIEALEYYRESVSKYLWVDNTLRFWERWR